MWHIWPQKNTLDYLINLKICETTFCRTLASLKEKRLMPRSSWRKASTTYLRAREVEFALAKFPVHEDHLSASLDMKERVVDPKTSTMSKYNIINGGFLAFDTNWSRSGGATIDQRILGPSSPKEIHRLPALRKAIANTALQSGLGVGLSPPAEGYPVVNPQDYELHQQTTLVQWIMFLQF